MAIKEIQIVQEGDKVIFVYDGKALKMHWQSALQIARLIHKQAKKAEEDASALKIAGDHAILFRAGFPIGLTSRPDIQEEAEHLAQYDYNLRRYMPGGVKSQERVGTPTVINHGNKEN
jgi:hypothetical protein